MDRSQRLKLDQPSSILKSAMHRPIAGVPYKDLSSAWDSMDKARSALNRVEHRLTDIEKRPTAEVLWNLPDYLFSMIEQDNQSSLNAVQTTMESMPSSDLRSPKLMRRKVNKPGRGSHEVSRQNESMFNQSERSVRISSVDSMAGVPSDPIFGNSSRYARSKNDSSTADFDLTSSTAIRETDINFLNDFTPVKKPVHMPAARLHRVNVIVPTASPASKATSHNGPMADSYPQSFTTRAALPSQPKSKIKFEEAKPFGNGEDVRNVSDGSQQNSDAESLDRIREMLRHQRTAEHVEQPCSVVSELSATNGVSVARKIAVGPRPVVSSYRGFNEVDSKSDVIKQKLAATFKIDQAKTKLLQSDHQEGHQPSSVLCHPHRNVAPLNEDAKKDLITTRSWRAGAKLVHDDLGVSINGVSPHSKDLRLHLSSPSKDNEASSKPSLSSEANSRLRNLVNISSEDASHVEKRLTEKKIKIRKKTSDDDSSSRKASVKKMYIDNKDAAEVRRYMLKRREEHLHQERQEQEMKAQMSAKKKQKLVDLMLKQQEIVAASVAARREKAAKQKLTVNPNGSDKENTKSFGEIDDVFSESESESRASNDSANRQHGLPQHEDSRPTRLDNRTITLEQHSHSKLFSNTDDSDESLNAEQIVNRFAEGAGLSLNDVITNYSQYAQAIQQSFTGRGSVEKSGANGQVNDVGLKPRSTLSRLRALQSASLHLQSRLQHETVRIRNDFASQDVEGTQIPISQNTLVQHLTVDQTSKVTKPVSFELDLPGYMGPQADSRALTGDTTETVLIQRRNESSTLSSNNRDGFFRSLRRSQVEHRLSKASQSAMHTSRWPKPANCTQHLLKPAKPVEAWKGSEVDPFNIFNLLNRDRNVIVHSRETNLDSRTIPISSHPFDHQTGDVVSTPTVVEADHSPKLTGECEFNSVSMWSASLSGLEPGRSEQLTRVMLNGHSAQHNVPLPQSTVSLISAQEPLANSDKEDSSTESGSLQFDLSAEPQDSLSVRPTQLLSKINIDSIGTDLQPSRSNINRRTGTELSEFSDISSLASDQQALTLSEQHHSSTAAGVERSQEYGRAPGISPAVLDIRMAMELSRLEMVDDSLLQVTNIERTRAVSLAQQETVALAQILKARQQKADHDIAAAKYKAEDESRELSHRLAMTRQVDATQSLFQAASDATSTLHESARTLLSTQTDMARVTAEAVRQIAEASALVLKRRDEDVDASRRLLAESAATAAASAITGIVDQYQSQRLFADTQQAELRRGHEASSALRTQPSLEKSHTASQTENDRSKSASQSKESSAPKGNSSQTGSLSDSSSIGSDLSKSVDLASYSNESSAVKPKQKKQLEKSDNLSSSQVTEDLAVVTDSETQQATRKRKSSMSDNGGSEYSEIHSATDMSMKSESKASYGPAKTSSENPSVHTAHDSSAEAVSVDEGSLHTESGLKSEPLQRSAQSSLVLMEEERVADYSFDYDSTLTEDDLERSLREIVPSEGQRKKIRKQKLLDSSAVEGATADDADELVIAPDDSFTRFNMAMVQQYFREEAIHQQHKHTMLLLRERALKEKTALELACLEQMKQRLRDKGADDKHPDIIRKERSIRKNHHQRQEELRNLQRASKLALEAQQLLLKETHDIAEIHRSSQQVKDKLRRAGLNPIALSSPEFPTDEEPSPRIPANESSLISRGSDDESAIRDKTKVNLKLDNKYLTSREKQLQDRRSKAVEKLDVNDRLKLKEEEIEQLENTTKRLQQLKESKPQVEKGSQNLAANSIVDTQAKLPTLSVEDLPSDSVSRKWSLASVGEEIVSEVASSKSLSEAVDKITESVKYSSHYDDSATEESSVVEEVSNARVSSSASSEATISENRTSSKVDSVTDRKATRLTNDEALVSKHSSTVTSDLSPKSSTIRMARQISASGELDISLNRSDLTPSDQSDIENRILALSERLKVCKAEAEGLRREQRKQRKIKLKAQEQSLKQQIESYDSYIRLVKSELHSSPVKQPASDVQKPKSSLPSFVSSALGVCDVVTKQQSSDSSGSEMTVVHDHSKVSRVLEPPGEPKKQVSHDHSISEVVSEEDVQSAVNEPSSLKLDLDASSNKLGSVATPRASDSARTNADVAEDFKMTPRDLSSARQPMSEVSERVVSSHPASVGSGVSYSEDFSSGRPSGSIDQASEHKHTSSPHKITSEHISEDSVPTEEDVSEVSLSRDSEAAKSVGMIVEMLQVENEQTIVAAETTVPLQPDNELDLVSESVKQTSETQNEAKTRSKDYQKVVDLTTEVLISEAIHQMIGIKRKKQVVSTSEGTTLAKGSATASQTVVQSVATSTMPIETSSLAAGDSPTSDLDDIYNELTSIKDDDEWLVQREKSSKKRVSPSSRLPIEVPLRVMHVPHTSSEVAQLVESAVDVLWPSQKDPKLREAAKLSFVEDHEASVETVEARSRSVYRRLIYDLSAQALSELSSDESAAHIDASTQPWLVPRLRVRAPPPATLADAKPMVCGAVLRRVGLEPSNTNTTSHRRAGGRTVRRVRADRVDELLLAELREEESEWTDYTNDELYVKMQLADVLFDMLLTETVTTLNSIHRHTTNS